jgi:hypothetical protein
MERVTGMEPKSNFFDRFFGVIVHKQTYLNALYLLLAFPLGLFYFIFLVTGLSLGISLVIIWVGLLLLAVVFAAWYGMLVFERRMAISLLHVDIPPMARESYAGKTTWQKVKAALANPVTWKGLLYLFAKFPLGILSFVVLVTFLSLSVSLLAAPFYYQWVQPQVSLDLGGRMLNNSIWLVDTLPEALLACFAGLAMAFLSLHIFNGLAWVSGRFARVMLGNFSSQPVLPHTPPAPAVPDLPEPPALGEQA